MTLNINKLLHHRSPYLLVDEVIEHGQEFIHAVKTPRLSEYYLQGHFPNAPIVPGAMMQEMTTQTAGLLIAEYHSPVKDYDSEKTKGYALGVLRSVHLAKFKSFARPDEPLDIKVQLIQKIDHSFRFKADIETQGKKVMSNEFTLVNISEDSLRGI